MFLFQQEIDLKQPLKLTVSCTSDRTKIKNQPITGEKNSFSFRPTLNQNRQPKTKSILDQKEDSSPMMTSSQSVQSSQAFGSHLHYIQQQQIQQEQGSQGEGSSTDALSPPLNMQTAAAIFTAAAHNNSLHQTQDREQVSCCLWLKWNILKSNFV